MVSMFRNRIVQKQNIIIINNKMRKRINFDIFKSNQIKAQKGENQLQSNLYSLSYDAIKDILEDVKKPFSNICIHGYYPYKIINFLDQHLYNNHKFIDNTKTKANLKPNLTIVDYLNVIQPKKIQSQIYSLNFINFQHSQQWILQQNKFDLIISCLQWNHVNSQEKLLKLYLNSLKPDGALVGCVMAQGTLSQLQWSYLMAENQRYGGISPKIMSFPQIGGIGNVLTTVNYQISTVISKEYRLQFDNPLDLIKAIQIIGQSGQLRGRRKAVYKDLLIAMYALYQSQYSQTTDLNQQKIICNLVLSPYIGWKFSQNQRKPLRRGQKSPDFNFIEELKKEDKDFQHFIVTQGSQIAEKVQESTNTIADAEKTDKKSQTD